MVDYATEAANDARLEAKMSATRSANDNLFTQMAKALENFKLPEMAFGVGPMGNRVGERSRRATGAVLCVCAGSLSPPGFSRRMHASPT